MHALMLVSGDISHDGRAIRMLDHWKEVCDTCVLESSKLSTVGSAPLLSERQSRVVSYFFTFFETIRRILRKRADLIIAENYYVAFSAWIASAILRIPLIYDAYELTFPGAYEKYTIRDYFWYAAEKLCIKKAVLVIAANSERAALMKKHYRLHTEPLAISNCPDPRKRIIDKEIVHRYAHLWMRNVSRVIYQGDMSLNRGIDRFIRAISLLDNVEMILVGNGPDSEKIRQLIVDLGLQDRVFKLDAVPSLRLINITQQCHIGIICYPYDGLNNQMCAPNKIFEYAQAGLPVIASDQPPLMRWISRYSIGKTIRRADTIEDIAESIRHMIESYDKYKSNITRFLEDNNIDTEKARFLKQVRTTMLHLHKKGA
jgi:glycosyltransferase involved in cell wall biosynthesis